MVRDILSRIQNCQHHTFILLTKRAERMWLFFRWLYSYGEVLPKNLWLGITICNQQEGDEKIPLLQETPAAKRFVSIEPMIGAVDISQWMPQVGSICHDGAVCHHSCQSSCHRLEMGYTLSNPTSLIDWVICGGETGPGARPMHPDWVRELRDQCKTAGIPFFFKGWGVWVELHTLQCNERGVRGRMWYNFDPDTSVCRVGKRRAGRLLDGVEHNAFPS